jgi:hypothetical protein
MKTTGDFLVFIRIVRYQNQSSPETFVCRGRIAYRLSGKTQSFVGRYCNLGICAFKHPNRLFKVLDGGMRVSAKQKLLTTEELVSAQKQAVLCLVTLP